MTLAGVIRVLDDKGSYASLGVVTTTTIGILLGSGIQG